MQENILSNLQNSKSNLQRNTIFHNYYTELQKFSKQFNDPLVELYAYYLYSNENSFSRKFYLTDLKKSTYYNNLLSRLEKTYVDTNYYKQYKNTLIKDQYPLLKSSNTTYKYLTYLLLILLLLSFFYNLKQIKANKNKAKADEVIDYKKVLTPQEQKVFVLMQNNSNKEIAEKLFVSVSTIKTHINNIYSKLSISSRKDINLYFKN